MCPKPPTLVVSGDFAKKILFILLKSLGAHGVALILGGMLLILGCIKLSFGKLIFCRKTKAEAMAEELKKRGLVNQQGGYWRKAGNKHAILSTDVDGPSGAEDDNSGNCMRSCVLCVQMVFCLCANVV